MSIKRGRSRLNESLLAICPDFKPVELGGLAQTFLGDPVFIADRGKPSHVFLVSRNTANLLAA